MTELEILELKFDERRQTVNDEEPGHFQHATEGKAYLVPVDDDAKVEIGTFSAIYVDVVGAVTEGESVYDVFDSHQTTLGYYEDLYQFDSADFKQSIVKAACGDDYIWAPSLLILDRLIIYPEFRGGSRGLLILRELIHCLRMGAGLVAMKPFPLQNEAHFLDKRHAAEREKLALDAFPQNQKLATAKLCRYYGRLGFKRVPRTGYMVLDSGRKLPTEAQLLAATPDTLRRA
jgi:hypothetical protein